MKIELEIRMILRSDYNTKHKADEICKFMDWNKKELIETINKFGCSQEGRNEIIRKMWKLKKK